MTTKPPDAVSAGLVTGLPAPFTAITVYTVSSLTSQVHYEYKTQQWGFIDASKDIALAEGSMTVHFWWNPTATELGYKWQTVDGTILGTTQIKLTAPVSSPSASAGQVPSTGPQSAPASTTTDAPSTAHSTTAPAQTGRPNHNDGVSGGAVAGVAIGCLAAGALLAGIILWFCWKRRQPPPAHDHETSRISLMHQEKGFSGHTASLASGSAAASPLSGNLPLPLEDKAISGEISKIGNSIKNHVQSYYHASRVTPGLIDYDDVQALGNKFPVSAGTLSTLLGNSATREVALRFCIAWVICSNMLPSKDTGTSLLPVEVAECFRRIEGGLSSSSSQAMLLARWRSHTAELLQPAYVRDPFNASDSRNDDVQIVVRALENILRPYADIRIDNEQRKRNLEEIIKRSALCAFTLFSQPSTWKFDWREEQSVKSGELCVFPALMQVTDETGQVLNPPSAFSEAVIRQLDA